MTEREELVERVKQAITGCIKVGDRVEPRGPRSFVTVGPVVVGIEEATRAAIAECEKESAAAYRMNARLENEVLRLEAQCAAMRAGLEWCGGMEHLATGNQISEMSPVKEALSPAAGRRVLDVVRAASTLLELLRDRIPHTGDGQPLFDSEEEASEFHEAEKSLSALGWKP